MKRRIRVGLITTIVWSVGLVLVAAAASVCSSCGIEASAAVPATCFPVR